MQNKKGIFVPEITSALRGNFIKVSEAAHRASGIVIFGKRIKTILFTTDVAIIANNNADAVIAVYPFTPQPSITQAIMSVSNKPVFCGVGGGITSGVRSANIALHAEFQGAIGVVLNSPATDETIELVKKSIDLPVVYTVVSVDVDLAGKIAAGVDIFNVSGGANTAKIVREIRSKYPEFPIIATGGPRDEDIEATVEAGANAITITPPSCGELLSGIMNKYRLEKM